MNRHLLLGMPALALTAFVSLPSRIVQGRAPVASKRLRAGDVDFHYLEAGHGEALLLLHGYTETSRMWRPLMSDLAEHFRVVAPDLPGIGESSIPESGLDMRQAALRIHDLLNALGISRARVVGHDIGMMVAYAYAAQFPTQVPQLVAMDARTLPGIGDWQTTYHQSGLWHFTFNGETAEELVRGRERIYFDHFWNDFVAHKSRSLSEVDRRYYTQCYARPGRMRAGWAYFAAFATTARDFASLAQDPLPMPVLVLTGDKGAGSALGRQFRRVARDVREQILEDTGHFVVDERPKDVLRALQAFLEP